MIFVTVGTTYFDELIMEVDRLIEAGVIAEEALAQIGSGSYLPKHMRWVRYLPELRCYYEAARLVICHGGVGTVFEMLAIGRPFIAVANRSLVDDHQADLLRALAAREWCVCCYEVSRLAETIEQFRSSRSYSGEAELARHVWNVLLDGEYQRRQGAGFTEGP